MDFDDAKENIQPLAQGRNASILQASLRVESPQELMAQRKDLERQIHNYTGNDPLSAWFNYIDWIEQSFPSGGKESGLQEVLAKCLSRFESDERYNQDRRMIKLYIKYIDNHKDPAECYQQLFNAGIGTMVSDFYIAWAYCYDLVNNTRKADEIFRQGIACRAQPLEELQEAHQHFGFSVAQRLMYKDDDNVQEETNRQLLERRLALSSLRGHRRKQLVGSIRTGVAVKNVLPGIIKNEGPSVSMHQRSNARVDVFKDENQSPNLVVASTSAEAAANVTTNEEGKSVVRSIIDAQRDQENRKEPGPWNKPHIKGKLFGKKKITNELGFEIHEDDDGGGQHDENVDDFQFPIIMAPQESKFDKPLKLPPNFCARNITQIDWLAPVTTEEYPEKNIIPEYNKCKLYPRPNVEFQPEELKAYRFLKKRGMENIFTRKRDLYWGCGPRYNLRQYPHFAKRSNPQVQDALDSFYAPPQSSDMAVAFNDIYNIKDKVERQFEEIVALRIRRNETIMTTTDMEETICFASEKVQRRKSFFPMRKSIAPFANKGSARKFSILHDCAETSEGLVDDDGSAKQMITSSSSAVPIFEDRETVETPKVLSKLMRQTHHERQYSSKEMLIKPTEILPLSASRDTTTPKIATRLDCGDENENEKESKKQITVKTSVALPIFDELEQVKSSKMRFKAQQPSTDSLLQKTPNELTTKQAEPFQIYQEESFVGQAIYPSKTFSNLQRDFEHQHTPAKGTIAKHSESFEIYQSEGFVNRTLKSTAPSSNEESFRNEQQDFQFKTPALPSMNPPGTSIKTNKIQFEIFEDNGNNATKPESGCGNGGYFDADETCSTQTFNIFLKEQSVSTPKTKPEPQRLFANVLKETKPTPTLEHQKEEEPQRVNILTVPNALRDISDENSLIPAALLSPQRKQLSTILETSEHGTTQSTHTTGASTKSTISSPEFDQESHNAQHQPTLDTVKEGAVEHSTAPSCTDDLDVMVGGLQIGVQLEEKTSDDRQVKGQQLMRFKPGFQAGSDSRLDSSILESTIEKNNKQQQPLNVSRCEFEKKTQPLNATPGVVRYQTNTGGRLDFSIFEDSMAKINKQHVGNFSRLEEKEDTEAGFAIKPIRFQEDKTETIPKMLLAPPAPIKFQEDKTETISNMLLAPPQPIRFQEDKTETITKLLLAPPQPVRFEEDKTETISKLMLAPPQPSKYEDEILPKVPIRENSILQSENQDNFFEFFSQSPPKVGKSTFSKPLDKGSLNLGHIRTPSANRTPINIDSKRVCERPTPEIQKPKYKQTSLFGDAAPQVKAILRDSFIPDFSLLDDSEQTKQQQGKTTKPKSVLRDSFMPDFSLIEDSQPKKPLQKATNDSFMPDFSHIPETQPISDDSFIPETQPIGSSSSQVKHNSIKTTLQSSYLPDFSMIAESQPVASSGEGQPASMKNILTDTFMKDFSEIKEPPPMPMDIKEMSMIQPSKNNSTLKLLEETISHKSNESICKPSNRSSIKTTTAPGKDSSGKLSFLAPPNPVKTPVRKKNSGDEKFFELNAETEMFGMNISMIKNSTWLPNHGPTIGMQSSQIQEDSLHIKQEEISSNSTSSSSSSVKVIQGKGIEQSKKIGILQPNSSELSTSLALSKRAQEPNLSTKFNSLKPKLSFLDKSTNVVNASRFSIDISQSELAAINAKRHQQQHSKPSQISTQSHIINSTEANDNDDFGEMSIYYKHTPKTPKAQVHIWEVPDEDAFKTPSNNRYQHIETDLNQTHQVIENICVDPNVNPFNVDLINAFLEQIQFTSYIQGLPNCMMVRSVHRLKASTKIRVNSIEFEVLKLIGEGAYGAVFCGKAVIGGKQIAMKQENPANLWEFYICLEIQDRILVDEMLPAYMSVDYALIGNNSSVLISQFSAYGSLISVCNKIKKRTMKNVDEYVVMVMATELLEIIDHLHAVSIIHADIKADNFLLMDKLKYPSKERCLQLIDFGVSIDMKQFKSNQTFSYVHSDNIFKCVEMREERPWTYQLDLYGLAGVLHVLLFGKYMDVEKKPIGIWMHKTHVPRYFNRNLWDTIFKTLLNIRDCNSMPNLQNLRALLKEELEEKEKYVVKMVNEFNKALAT